MDNELAKKQGAILSVKEKAVAKMGIAAVAFCLAWAEWLTPSVPPFVGKWAWTKIWAFEVMGPRGIVGIWMALGTLMLALGLMQLWNSEKRTH
ncbi:MAG: hypothetical protein H0W47_08130 [Polaromonas sp.]|uniref:hypothetical protein n=1 Tax=Polaromonas sp. TaxID=1869339 RepID=UPI001801A35D|nr:hypothetical protein [Polaromonas sp.]MBA3593756.1 hypothetical protein [Polaromonas sp.]